MDQGKSDKQRESDGKCFGWAIGGILACIVFYFLFETIKNLGL